ncbi:hypothetical protein DMB66_56340 [Actinoplanes sp. ATCC 53533]|nr:hypothetical protein DMB66_56340 [Actinoplanes sp. ATCC 53533]
MRSTIRPLRTAAAWVGVSVAALTVMLAVSMPAAAGVPDAVGQAWTSPAWSALAGRAETILRWARCPIVRNGSLTLR